MKKIYVTGIGPGEERYMTLQAKEALGDSDIIYTVEDCGVHGNWVDVYYETSSQANSHGLQYKEVFLVE